MNDTGSVMVQNVIVGNQGDGVSLSVGSSPVVFTKNTVARNTGSGVRTSGFAAKAVLTNDIIADGLRCDTLYSSVPPVVRSTNAQEFNDGCSALAHSNGNFSADPQFVDAENFDFHLTLGSPSVDAGDNSAPELPVADADGQPRIGAGRVDQGAYELASSADANGEFTALPPAGSSTPATAPVARARAAVQRVPGRRPDHRSRRRPCEWPPAQRPDTRVDRAVQQRRSDASRARRLRLLHGERT